MTRVRMGRASGISPLRAYSLRGAVSYDAALEEAASVPQCSHTATSPPSQTESASGCLCYNGAFYRGRACQQAEPVHREPRRGGGGNPDRRMRIRAGKPG